jgi:hypothetical protein
VGILYRKKASLKHYNLVLRPNEFGPRPNRILLWLSKPAPWIAKFFSWLNSFIPKQSKRALWLSKPSNWFRKLRKRMKNMSPKPRRRSLWLSRIFDVFRKLFSKQRSRTFKEIQNALDNSKFNEDSKLKHSP